MSCGFLSLLFHGLSRHKPHVGLYIVHPGVGWYDLKRRQVSLPRELPGGSRDRACSRGTLLLEPEQYKAAAEELFGKLEQMIRHRRILRVLAIVAKSNKYLDPALELWRTPLVSGTS